MFNYLEEITSPLSRLYFYFFRKKKPHTTTAAGRIDIIMFIEPMVPEAPTGITGQPRWFSRQEAGQEWDAGAHNSAYKSFFHQKNKIL